MRTAKDSSEFTFRCKLPNPSHCIDGSGYCILTTLIWQVLYLFFFKPYSFCCCSLMTLSSQSTIYHNTISSIIIQETYEYRIKSIPSSELLHIYYAVNCYLHTWLTGLLFTRHYFNKNSMHWSLTNWSLVLL